VRFLANGTELYVTDAPLSKKALVQHHALLMAAINDFR